MELTTLGSFLRTVGHGGVNRLAAVDVTCVCDNNGVFICVSESMVREWFAIGIFRVCVVCIVARFWLFWRLLG